MVYDELIPVFYEDCWFHAHDALEIPDKMSLVGIPAIKRGLSEFQFFS
jgi:hypothetical protein